MECLERHKRMFLSLESRIPPHLFYTYDCWKTKWGLREEGTGKLFEEYWKPLIGQNDQYHAELSKLASELEDAYLVGWQIKAAFETLKQIRNYLNNPEI